MIGSSITADDLANGQQGKDPYPGLARVSPTNTDEARALASFADVTAGKALLVYDKPGDPYSRTLQSSFEKLLKGSPYQPQPFTPPTDRSKEGTTANTFRQITHLVCDTARSTDTILFAGRHTQLRQFINALGDRGCQDRSFTLLTGDEGSYLTGDKDLDRTALQHRISVRYTALAHPDAWLAKDAPKSGGSAADAKVLDELLADSARKPVGPIGEVSLEGRTDDHRVRRHDARRPGHPRGHGRRADGPAHRGRRQPVDADEGLPAGERRERLDLPGRPRQPVRQGRPDRGTDPRGQARFVEIAWPEGHAPNSKCLPPAHP